MHKTPKELFEQLSITNPSAAKLLLTVRSLVGENQALKASQEILAGRADMSVTTLRKAVEVLVKDNWMQVLNTGHSKAAKLYVINDRIILSDKGGTPVKATVIEYQ